MPWRASDGRLLAAPWAPRAGGFSLARAAGVPVAYGPHRGAPGPGRRQPISFEEATGAAAP
jgi:hypothetical protein